MKRIWMCLVGLGAGLAAMAPVRAAIPAASGGELRMTAGAPIRSLDPIRADTPMRVSLVMAVYDRLYRWGRGHPTPALAHSLPALDADGRRARIALRRGVRLHNGRTLDASDVLRALRRVADDPAVSWLLAQVKREGDALAVRATDPHTLELDLLPGGVPLEESLAAFPLSIPGRSTPDRRASRRRRPSPRAFRPVGTGPFRVRVDGRGGADLRAYPRAAEGAPRLRRIRLLPPRDRDEETRAFELGRLDLSFAGRSLYGGRPMRPVRSTPVGGPAVMLVPRRVLGPGGARPFSGWAAVVRAVHRRRLTRVGIRPSARLVDVLPAPALPPPAPRHLAAASTLTLRVAAGDRFLGRVAETLVAMLDEGGVRVRVAAAGPAATASDLALLRVPAPLPTPWATLASALAVSGQPELARAVALRAYDRAYLEDVARAMDALVLGRQQRVLHHRADLGGLRVSRLGGLDWSELFLLRRAEPFRAGPSPTGPSPTGPSPTGPSPTGPSR